MVTDKEALALALEALELSAVTVDSFGVQKKTQEAITAIKQALAAPTVGEPVAWMSASRFEELRKGFTVMTTLTKQRAFEDDVAIHTTPPAAPVQPVMTDEKGRPISFWGGKSVEPIKQPAPDTHPLPLKDCWFVNRFDFSQTPPYFRYDTDDRTAKENESELWEIQTQLREQGFELVDYQVEHDCITGYLSKVTQPAPVPTSWMETVTANLVREGVNKHKARELAEHFYGFAQRPFVGLTNEDVKDLCGEASNFGTSSWINHIESKLRSKNNG